MSTEELLKALSNETGAKEQEILDRARKEAEKLRAEAKSDVERMRETLKEEVERFERRLRRREMASVEMEVKSQRLKREKEDYSRVKEMALERLMNLPPKENEALLIALAGNAKETLERSKTPLVKGGGFTFRSRETDRAIVEKVTGFTFEGPLDGGGGLVIYNRDKTLVYDLRFSKLLEHYWSDSMKTVSSILKW